MTDDDDDLMARLRAAADRVDPPPGPVVEAARAALSTRRLDAELAQLVADSDLVGAGVVRAGDDEPRLLVFEVGDVLLELQVEHVRGQVEVRGLVTGAGGSAVVESGAGPREAPIDEDGWFTAAGLSGGPLRVRLRAPDGTAVVTGWVSV
ncbi:hypothetical protein ACFQV2_11670 [Actinokineospora soli]|uniref:Uncharacterized protein n=1 Tax=Actinokineospora soli TaxID=1048753 RepID=A0ABW2TLH8_9PSEU